MSAERPEDQAWVWGVNPRRHYGRTANAMAGIESPWAYPTTFFLPGAEGQVIAGFDPKQRRQVGPRPMET